MNEDLLNELHDAGFRSDHQMDMDTGDWCVDCNYVKEDKTKGFDDMCFPTLEELIRACGNDFQCLDMGSRKEWTAYAESEHEGMFGIDGKGSTPSEAVARLWLALNSKSNG